MTDSLDPRTEAIFDAVVDLSPTERERVLAERCDDELRRRVRALLACDTPTELEGVGTLRPVEEGPGSRIGPYEIVARLGEGGMGTVWLAEQREPLPRRVALKIIKLGMDTRRVIARFEMERTVLALLDHPSIARVLDAGATDRGRPYFVMDLVEGEPLVSYCDARRMDVPARLRLFLQVCRAMQHAHQRGIIHRDLKPSNVLVREEDGRAVPKIIDFGIAKATTPETGSSTPLTEQHQVVGTPEYMSPEQAGHGGGEVDTRSDIYSLGVLLYEILTGTTPHRRLREGISPTPSRGLETLGERVADLAGARGTTPRGLRRHLHGGLDWIVQRCLEREKNRRYDSAAALANDVQAYLADEPLDAGPLELGYRVRTFVKRHRTVFAATTAILVAFFVLVIGFLVALYEKSIEERRSREEVEAALRENQIERGRLLGMTGNLSLAEELLWAQYLDTGSPAARWALWELYWRYPCAATRDVESRVVDSVDFHPDGRLLAAGQMNGVVGLWSIPEMRCEATLHGHVEQVPQLAFSPVNQRLLVSASTDGTVRLWNVESGEQIRVLRHPAGVWSLCLSPDGRRLATGDDEGVVRLWDVSTGRLTHASDAAGMPRRAVRFDGSGALLASSREDGRIDLYELREEETEAALRPIHAFVGHRGLVHALRLGADGRTLYSAGSDRTVRAWDLVARRPLGSLEPGTGPVRDVVPTAGGDVYVLSNRVAERWSEGLEQRRSTVRLSSSTMMAHSGVHYCVADAGVDSDGAIRGRLRLFETEARGALVRTPAHEGIAYALAVSPADSHVVTGGTDGMVRHWVDGRAAYAHADHAGQVNAAAFDPEGRYVVTASLAGDVHVRDAATGAVLSRTQGFSTAGAPLAIAPRGDRFVAGREDGMISIRALPSGELLSELRVSEEEVVGVAFSPDGERLATVARDRRVRLWDGKTYAPCATIGFQASPWVARFSPDGRTLAVGTWLQQIILLDVATGNRVGVLRGHHALVRDLAFAPGRLEARLGIRALVSASDDGTLKLWDLERKRCMLTLPADEAAFSVAWLPGDDPRLVSTHGQGMLARWDLAYYDRHIEGNRAHQERMHGHR